MRVFVLFLISFHIIASPAIASQIEVTSSKSTSFFKRVEDKLYENIEVNILNKGNKVGEVCFVSDYIYKGEKCIKNLNKGEEKEYLLILYNEEEFFEREIEYSTDEEKGKAEIKFKRGKPQLRVYFLNHFHYDPVWKHPEGSRGYLLLAFDLIKEYTNLGLRKPYFRFVLEQIPYLKPYIDAYPEERKNLKKMIEGGTLEIVGGTYNQPDNATPLGEELIRNVIYGKKFDKKFFSVDAENVWQIDTFGHTPQFVQMLKDAGMKSLTIFRGGPKSPPFDFIWVSPAGDELLGYDLGVAHKIAEIVDIDLSKGLSNEQIRKSLFTLMPFLEGLFSTPNILIPAGDDFAHPWEYYVNILKSVMKPYESPKILWASPKEYFKVIEEEYEKINPRILTFDANPVFSGCYTTRLEMKKAHRLLSLTYLDAEKWAAIASILGRPYPYEKLDLSLRYLLYNQHHDSIPGTSEGYAVVDTWWNYYEGWRLAREVLESSIKYIANRISSPSHPFVVVFNSLSWERSEVVEIKVNKNYKVFEGEKEVPQEKFRAGDEDYLRFLALGVPPLGYKIYSLRQGEISEEEKIEGYAIKNDLISVEVDENGLVKSIEVNEKGRAEFKEGNKIISREDNGDLWTIKYTGKSWEEELKEIKKIRTNLKEELVIKSSLEGIELTKRITLYKGIPVVFFEVDFPTAKAPRLYKVNFKLKGGSNLLPYFNEKFFTICRKEGVEYPGAKWVDLSKGTSLIYKGKKKAVTSLGVIIKGNNKLYSEVKDLLVFLIKRGVSGGMYGEKVEDAGDLWVEIKGEGIEWEGEILRVGEDVWSKFSSLLREGVEKGNNVDLNDWKIKDEGERLGFALLNQGGVGYEVKDGTIKYSLLRTVDKRLHSREQIEGKGKAATTPNYALQDWGGIIRYALYLHRGGWKEVVKKGWEYNVLLRADVVEKSGSALPSRLSFFESNFPIVALKNGGGEFGEKGGNNIVLRVYDPYGEGGDVKIKSWVDLNWKRGNILEEVVEGALNLNPWEIGTFTSDLEDKISEEKFSVQYPLYVKYYLHNESIAPPSFLPLVVEWGRVKDGKVEIKAVNNEEKKVKVEINIKGWGVEAEREKLLWEMEGREVKVEEMKVEGRGKLSLTYICDGKRYIDFLHLGEKPLIEVEAKGEKLRVKNPNPYPLSVYLYLAFPFEGFGIQNYTYYGFNKGFDFVELDAGKETRVEIARTKLVERDMPIIWKIGYEGNLIYLPQVIRE